MLMCLLSSHIVICLCHSSRVRSGGGWARGLGCDLCARARAAAGRGASRQTGEDARPQFQQFNNFNNRNIWRVARVIRPRRFGRRRLTAHRTSPKSESRMLLVRSPVAPRSSRRSQRCHPTLSASDQAQVLELELAHELLEQCDDGPTMLEVDGHLFEHLALALSLA